MTVRNVLIVDDSQTDTLIVSGLLEANGYSILTASNAEDGIRMARDSSPDCILMDIVMPGTSGLQATRDLSSDPRTAGIPVVILSSRSMESDKVWAGRQGAVDYLVKPVKERDLLGVLESLGTVAG